MEENIETPFWKRIWQTATTVNSIIHSSEVVSQVMKIFAANVCEGLAFYRPYEKEDMVEWEKKLQNPNIDTYFKNFFKRLCKSLNLHPDVGWGVFCNYLVYEYYGKLANIEIKLLYEVNIVRIIEDIWHFYCSERMFFVKTFKYVLEHYNTKNHKYRSHFVKTVEKVTPEVLFKSIFKQFQYLIIEIDNAHVDNCVSLESWVHRNAREQQEMAMILTAFAKIKEFTSDEVIEIIRLYSQYDFAQSPSYINSLSIDSSTLYDVGLAEIGAVLVSVEQWWINKYLWASQKQELIRVMHDLKRDQPLNLIVWYVLGKIMDVPNMFGEDNELMIYEGKIAALNFQSFFCNTLTIVVKNPMFANSLAGKAVLNAIYMLFTNVYLKWNSDNIMCMQIKALPLLEEIINHKELAADLFGNPSQPLRSLFKFIIDLFPYQFFTITKIATSLIENDVCLKPILEILNNFNQYTEEYPNPIPNDSSVELRHEYFPAPDSTIISFGPGTHVIGMTCFDKSLVKYQSSYSYYDYLAMEVEVLAAHVKRQMPLPSERIARIIEGYKLISQIAKNCLPSLATNASFVRCLNMLDVVTFTFTDESNRNFKLFQTFFQVFVALTSSAVDVKINFKSKDILPKLSVQRELTVENLLQPNVHPWGLLPEFLKLEMATTNHELVVIYLELLGGCWNRGKNYTEIQIPGMVYMMRNVFEKYQTWEYTNKMQKHKISYLCLQLLSDILAENSDSDVHKKLMFSYCLQTSLFNKCTVNAYLEILTMTNLSMQKELEDEIDWEEGESLIIIKIIKLLLKSLMLLLRNRHLCSTKNLSVLEYRLLFSKIKYASPIKVTTGYINNVFDSAIQILAVRVLLLIIKECNESLVGPLDLDDHQLKALFFDKLRDPVEDITLRKSIIDLIITSVDYQPGLTRAFFNVKATNESGEEPTGDNLEGIMVDFLKNMQLSTDTLQSPLQAGILELLHKLWTAGQSSLLRNVTRLKTFWSLLTAPIFEVRNQSAELYGRIFGIMAIEIMTNPIDIHPNLQQILFKFFHLDEGHVDRCRDLLMSVMRSDTKSRANDLHLLSSWRYLVALVDDYEPACLDNAKIRTTILGISLEALNVYFDSPTNDRILEIWVENYLVSVSSWGASCLWAPKFVFSKLTHVVQSIVENPKYNVSKESWKRAFLCALLRTIASLKSYIDENMESLKFFFMYLGRLLSVEYEIANVREITQDCAIKVPDELLNWVLVLSIYKHLFLLENLDHLWFHSFDFFNRSVGYVGEFIKNPRTLRLAKMAVKTLTCFVRSPKGGDILHSPLSAFSQLSMPPKSYIDPNAFNRKTLPQFTEWWATYGEIIKFQNALLDKYDVLVMDDCFSFLFVHDKIIAHSLNLVELTVTSHALKLVVHCLQFVNNLMKWKNRWVLKSEISFNHIMVALRRSLNCVTSVLVRPNCLKFFKSNDFASDVPHFKLEAEYVSHTLQTLLEIVMLTFSSFLKSSPGFLTFLNTSVPDVCVNELVVDLYTPKVGEKVIIPTQLSYGGLISLLQFLCKLVAKNAMEQKRSDEESSVASTTDSYSSNVTSYVALISHSYLNLSTPPEKLKMPKKPDITDFSFLQGGWFPIRDMEAAHTSIEMLVTLITMELQVQLFSPKIDPHILDYVTRELYAEVNFFKEFVEKGMVEKYRAANISPVHGVKATQRHLDLLRLSNYMRRKVAESDVDFHEEFLQAMLSWFYGVCSVANKMDI